MLKHIMAFDTSSFSASLYLTKGMGVVVGNGPQPADQLKCRSTGMLGIGSEISIFFYVLLCKLQQHVLSSAMCQLLRKFQSMFSFFHPLSSPYPAIDARLVSRVLLRSLEAVRGGGSGESRDATFFCWAKKSPAGGASARISTSSIRCSLSGRWAFPISQAC